MTLGSRSEGRGERDREGGRDSWERLTDGDWCGHLGLTLSTVYLMIAPVEGGRLGHLSTVSSPLVEIGFAGAITGPLICKLCCMGCEGSPKCPSGEGRGVLCTGTA